ncbi:hypothetical protein GGP57_003066 [Salinibacter ruber]|uniref:Uncharacterized protein n=1 Tax=Salinibacter ruber TaxID=146919 RepID=A0A9X2PMY2_9BACT|nr:hypothetical protein [Salinibacter ruber]MCS3635726.1 hypothetical protein [Salinibacter ruber]MCS3638774.1 hypothetical protein [Salinibacter ruber]MCS3715183.1 hypothetical protein [Salinibacter ruber]MCS4122332.1 hypothetical protein [Salinibacter ruber]
MSAPPCRGTERRSTALSIRKIKKALKETRDEDVSRGVVGRVVKEVRSEG